MELLGQSIQLLTLFHNIKANKKTQVFLLIVWQNKKVSRYSLAYSITVPTMLTNVYYGLLQFHLGLLARNFLRLKYFHKTPY